MSFFNSFKSNFKSGEMGYFSREEIGRYSNFENLSGSFIIGFPDFIFVINLFATALLPSGIINSTFPKYLNFSIFIQYPSSSYVSRSAVLAKSSIEGFSGLEHS